jgi:hypothetical protein
MGAKRKPPAELWREAGGDREEYKRLMIEHGWLVPRKPGEESKPLPCGWDPYRKRDGQDR